jgi:hypothetical protein
MTTILNSCKECFGVKTDGGKLKYQKPNCPFEHAKDYKDTYDFFKNKWNEDFPQLLQAASALTQEAQACRTERNAMMPLLQQQEMMESMEKMYKQMNETIDNFFEKIVGGKKTQKMPLAPKQSPAPNGNGTKWEMWRPDIKEENIQDAIEKLKAKYPSLTDADIDISSNKNNHKSIRYKLPSP